VEGKFTSSKYVSSVQSVKRDIPKPAKHVYIGITFRLEPLGKNRGTGRSDAQASDALSSVWCIRSHHVSRTFKVQRSLQRAPDASNVEHSVSDAEHLMHSSKHPETIFAHRTCPTVGQRTPLHPVHVRVRRRC
jgi:hypothetical protein